MESSEGSLTPLAVEAVILNTYTCPLHTLLGLPHGVMARFQEQGTKRKQAEAVAPFMTYPEKSHGVTSARVNSPAISKGKEHTVYLSVGQLSKITL